MPIQLDSERNETKALLDYACDLAGKRVLEIGCGEGRLTWRYAHRAAFVTAIDSNAEKVARAWAALPQALRGRVEFHALGLQDFAAGPGRRSRFDLALLSWSL
ncbi:MAG: class I SAM-dependent methyltransferase [Anaerolineales bacterium]|nr:class I SAM-dependent methyltransferase [Anaerolineales bacterium]